ncbi:MAG: phage tail protein [Chloroflexi bacterium]|nr:phage tail protein [Chloroflexota bacterium]
MPVDPTKQDVITTFQWVIEIDGLDWGFFRECSGLSSEHEVVEVKATSAKGIDFVRKTPGRLKWGDIALKRGLTTGDDMWKWRKAIEDGGIASQRKNGSVVMYDYAGAEVARWNFKNAWPSKYGGPSLNVGSSEAAVEELTLVHEGIDRIK